MTDSTENMNALESSNCCGVVTLYNPHDGVIEFIDSYLSHLDKLYVVDNSPEPSPHILGVLRQHAEIEVLSSNGNTGVAAALNLGARRALQDGYTWLLTMDQDSYFCQSQIVKIIRALATVDYETTAIVSPMHDPAHLSAGPCRLEPKLVTITSGSFLNLSLIQSIGFFDEKLFIDEVDHDYCLRANLCGYQVLQATNCFLLHQIGTPTRRRFLLRVRTVYEHNPKRIYFIVRNNLYIQAKYHEAFPRYTRKNRRHVRKHVLAHFKYSPDRLTYLRYWLLAKKHFRQGVFGNAVNL